MPTPVVLSSVFSLSVNGEVGVLGVSQAEGRERQNQCGGWAPCHLGCMSLPTVLICLCGFSFSDNVSAYCLHIAEDDGEVDTDFRAVDSYEPIHKF